MSSPTERSVLLPVLASAGLCLALSAGARAGTRTLTVAADGSGVFRTVTEALTAAKDATQADPVDIRIQPGTYTETLTTLDWVNLIGADRDTCIIRYDGGPENTVHKHTLWATTNSTLKNLTLIGGEVKYVIHSDGGRAYVLRIENCTLRREYPNAHAEQYPAAFGIGLHANQHIVMTDCRLEAILPIYWHNWNAQAAGCSMTLERCTLNGRKYAVGIYNLGSRQQDFFVLHDCVLTGAEGAVQYANQRHIKGTTWDGQDETALLGSGNTIAGAIVGTVMQDDSGKRRSGLDLCGAHPAPVAPPATGVRLEERYGTGPGRVRGPTMWTPVTKPGPYCLRAEVADSALALVCPPAPENSGTFGYVGGPAGAQVQMPLVLELRLRLTPASAGQAQLYYCRQPQGWLIAWHPDRVGDAGNPAAAIPVDTALWQTYRLVAKTPDDVRLFVDGVPGDGVPLKSFKHTAEYFQFRVVGHGTRVELDYTKLTGLP